MSTATDTPKACSASWPQLAVTAHLRVPRSSAERWAHFVLRACDADQDLPRLRDWASMVAVSYSVLREVCRMAGVSPHDARDFMRTLRALWHTGGRIEHVDAELDVRDHRTLAVLLRRAGLGKECPSRTLSLGNFLQRQQFIETGHPALIAIEALLAHAQLPNSSEMPRTYS